MDRKTFTQLIRTSELLGRFLGPNMKNSLKRRSRSFVFISVAALTTFVCLGCLLAEAAEKASSQTKWRITSIKICRSRSGQVHPIISAVGSYPVYTFFIPRPVWTVNGSVVEAKAVYEHGRLVSFQLLDAAPRLNPGTKNTIKFALPDHNGSATFLYDHSQIPPGECYEFF